MDNRLFDGSEKGRCYPTNSPTFRNENIEIPAKSARNVVTALWQLWAVLEFFAFKMSRFTVEKHYGEWMLSRWYDNIPGPDRLVEVSTSLNEQEAFNLVNAWSKKLLTPGLDPERLNSITESLISSHWNQACRMGCLAVQFTYINGFYHRFVWRVS